MDKSSDLADDSDIDCSHFLSLSKNILNRFLPHGDTKKCNSPALETANGSRHGSDGHSGKSNQSGSNQSSCPSTPSSFVRTGSVGSGKSSCYGDLRDRVSGNGGTIFLGSRVFLCPSEAAETEEKALTIQQASDQLQLPMLDLSQDDLGGLKQWADQVSLWRMACDSLLNEMTVRNGQLDDNKAKLEASSVSLRAELQHERDHLQRMLQNRSIITSHTSNSIILIGKMGQRFGILLAKDLHASGTEERKQLQVLIRSCHSTGKKFFSVSLFNKIDQMKTALVTLTNLPPVQLDRQSATQLRCLETKLVNRRAELDNAKQLLAQAAAVSATHRQTQAQLKESRAAIQLKELKCIDEAPKDVVKQQMQDLVILERRRLKRQRMQQLSESERQVDDKLTHLRIQWHSLATAVWQKQRQPLKCGPNRQTATTSTRSTELSQKRLRLKTLQRQLCAVKARRRSDALARKVTRLKRRVCAAEAAARSITRARRQLAVRRRLQAEASQAAAIVDKLLVSSAGRRRLHWLFVGARARLSGILRRLQLWPLRRRVEPSRAARIACLNSNSNRPGR